MFDWLGHNDASTDGAWLIRHSPEQLEHISGDRCGSKRSVPSNVAFLFDPLHVQDLRVIQLVSSMAKSITMTMSMPSIEPVEFSVLLQATPQHSESLEQLTVAFADADEGIDLRRSVEGGFSQATDFRSQ